MTALQSPTSVSPSPLSGSKIEFWIPGLPGAQGSKVLTRWGSMRESSKKVGPWRQAVMWITENEYHSPPINEAVYVEMIFFFARPKSHYGTGKNSAKLKDSAPKHCTSLIHGDLEKLARSTNDGLSHSSGGCVLKDDSLVVELRCSKRYASASESTGALVRIARIS